MPNYRSKNGKPLSAYNANKRTSSKSFIVPKSLELSSISVYKRTNCLDIFIYENSEAIPAAFYRFLILFVTLCLFFFILFPFVSPQTQSHLFTKPMNNSWYVFMLSYSNNNKKKTKKKETISQKPFFLIKQLTNGTRFCIFSILSLWLIAFPM